MLFDNFYLRKKQTECFLFLFFFIKLQKECFLSLNVFISIAYYLVIHYYFARFVEQNTLSDQLFEFFSPDTLKKKSS